MTEPKYRYYTNGVWPIRATIGINDVISATEVPSRETGELILEMRWCEKISWDQSGDVDQITKGEFETMCRDFLAEKKSKPELSIE